ncbi:MAG: rhomboid family intramembrane serine protease [Pseudomonadota bacterium]
MNFLTDFPITTALIAANLAASFYAFSNRDFYEQNLFRVGNVTKGNEWHRVVTSGFLHVDPMHLLFNMYALYLFGRILEQVLGPAGYLIVYFGSLLGASAWMLWDKRRQLNYSAVGASGAVSGIILSFCLFAPLAQLSFFFIPMPAIVFGAAYIGISLYLSQRQNAIIAHGAHLGGALAGLVLTAMVEPRAITAFLGAFGLA